ncbi:MAG: L,D-transpeptidase family protein, partial [Dongiaceae bacterium]
MYETPRHAGALALVALALLLPPQSAEAESQIKSEGPAGLGPPDAAPSPVEGAIASALNRLLTEGDPGLPAIERMADLWDYYAGRGFAPIWAGADSPTAQGSTALDTLAAIGENAAADLSARLAPLVDAAASRSVNPDESALAEFELLVSAAVLTASVDPERPWAAAEDAGVLAAAAAGDVDAFDGYLPPDPAFWRLRAMVDVYQNMIAAGPWPVVVAGPKLEPGAKDPRIAELRNRLAATGDLTATATDPELYDEALVQDVRRFHSRHGLADDGVIGFGTIDALNLPVEQRLAAMIYNLGRLQREGRHWERSHIAVNIPAAQLGLVQDGKTTMRLNVIVGRVDRQTPLIDSAINRIEFNPFWTVPPKIAANDLLPKIRKDKKFLENHSFKVYASWESANEVDPDSVEWTSGAARRLRLRQDPGPENALGPAKFLFPNQYDVYLHGTNKQSLFQNTDRFLSSGCVRVSDPIGLAELILNNDQDWSAERIAQALKSGRNQGLALKPALPVHLIYLT